ncbi:hypothetical protein CICLE_v10033405mg, partial [Citrus x clementina]
TESPPVMFYAKICLVQDLLGRSFRVSVAEARLPRHQFEAVIKLILSCFDSTMSVVEKILISVREKLDPIVTAIEEPKDIWTLPMTELAGSPLAWVKRLNRHNGSSVESTFRSKLNMQ